METVFKKLKPLEISLTKHLDTVFLFSLYTVSFLIPLLIQHPQLLVGVCVNTAILISTFRYGFKKTVPLLILPSIAAYSRGVLFGGATMFLLYFIPFIITSNAIYSLISRGIKNKVLGILISSITKASFLFAIANVFVNSKGFPEIFLTTMGINQLITAVVGGGIAVVLFSTIKQKEQIETK